MCGIAGLLTFDRDAGFDPVDVVARMTRAQRHRGPDADGQWDARTRTGGRIAFGHTRLAIIDLSTAGRQPMVRRHLTATFNGEIYNYRELKDLLRGTGSQFTTESDTEVLLAAFERWGPAAVDRLDGMFAAAVWDAYENKLWLVRDRLGIKPLYVHRGQRYLAFASEVRALLAGGLAKPELDPQSLWHYAGYQTTPTPATLVRDIRMVEPGHFLNVRAAGEVESRRYWSLLGANSNEPAPDSVKAAAPGVADRLRAAVASHLVSDVPVGVFLSGGIDSGALVSILKSLDVRPRTFTVTLDDEKADESSDARRIATRFGTDHNEIHLKADDLLAMMPEVLAATDHPSGDGVNTYVVSRAVRAHGITVALSGLGGDELFGGYPSFARLSRVEPAARHLKHSPPPVRKAAAELLRAAGGGRVTVTKAAALLESDGSVEQMWPVTRQLFSSGDRQDLLSPAVLARVNQADAYEPVLRDAFASAPDAPLWSRISFAEARGYMHDLLLRDTDQTSMAHALEVRVPLLDHRLVSHVLALPDAAKRDGETPKALLVRSLALPLPDESVHSPKRGFSLPFDAWMRGALRSFCEAQLGPSGLDGRGLLRPGAGAELWQGFLARRHGVTWSRVWSLVALNAWLDRHGIRASAADL